MSQQATAETKTPGRDEIEAAVRDFLKADAAEQRLHAILEKLPGHRVILYQDGKSIMLESEYCGTRVNVRRDVVDLGPVEL